MPDTSPSQPTDRVRPVVYLTLFALAAAAVLATAERLTMPRIAENQLAERLKALQAVLPEGQFDNEPHLDFIYAQHPELLGSDEPVPIYRARKNRQPIAAIVTAVAPKGFSDEIRLLVAVYATGKVAGVRVIEHKETPGLGDKIEARKSNWINGFRGLLGCLGCAGTRPVPAHMDPFAARSFCFSARTAGFQQSTGPVPARARHRLQ